MQASTLIVLLVIAADVLFCGESRFNAVRSGLAPSSGSSNVDSGDAALSEDELCVSAEVIDDVSHARVQRILAATDGNLPPKLCFQRCAIQSAALQKIIYHLLYVAPGVRELSFHHCNLNSEILSRCVYLENQMNHAEMLDVSFSLNTADTKSVKHFAAIVSCVGSMKTVILDGNKLSVDSLRTLAHAFRRHPSLARISMSLCSLEDDCMGYLQYCLTSNRNITSVDLSSNCLSAEGVEELTQRGALKMIEYLDISFNSVGDAGLRILSNAIASKQLPQLKHLFIKQVGASTAGIEKFLRSFPSEAPLVTLDVSGNNLFGPEKKPKGLAGKSKHLLKTINLEQSIKSISTSVSGLLNSVGMDTTKSPKRYVTASSASPKSRRLLIENKKSKSKPSRKSRGKASARSSTDKKGKQKKEKKEKKNKKEKVNVIEQLLNTLVKFPSNMKNFEFLGMAKVGMSDGMGRTLLDVAKRAQKNGKNGAQGVKRGSKSVKGTEPSAVEDSEGTAVDASSSSSATSKEREFVVSLELNTLKDSTCAAIQSTLNCMR